MEARDGSLVPASQALLIRLHLLLECTVTLISCGFGLVSVLESERCVGS